MKTTLKTSKLIQHSIGMLLLLIGLNTFAQQNKSKPNIILFLVDDMGIMDTSVPFCAEMMPLNKRYHTPNMERLAKQGMKFTNAYAQPVVRLPEQACLPE